MSLVRNLIQKRSDGTSVDALLEEAAYRHNLKGAVRDLKLLSEMVSEGYRFDDEDAGEHRAAFERAVATVEGYFREKLR